MSNDVPDFLEEGFEPSSVTADKSLSKLQGRLVDEMPLGSLIPNDWNPNTMNDREFQLLVDRLRDNGMLQPIQAIPHPSQPDKYVIIGGEHRWKAAEVLGWETLPVLIMDGEAMGDEDNQKFVTMQLNVLSGHLDQAKFLKMYTDLAERHKSEVMSDMMGFANKAAFARVIKDMASGMPDEKMAQEFTERAEGVATNDTKALGDIVSELMEKHGGDLDNSNFMVFDAGGKT